jgi:hypothetical protein
MEEAKGITVKEIGKFSGVQANILQENGCAICSAQSSQV